MQIYHRQVHMWFLSFSNCFASMCNYFIGLTFQDFFIVAILR